MVAQEDKTASSIKAADFDLRGHLGHLDEKQQAAFDSFKTKVENEIEVSKYEGGREKWWDDPTLLRYLRARSYNLDLAFKQFEASDKWRKEKKVDQLYENFSIEDFEDARKYYPRFTGRRDLIGRPVYVYRLASLSGENTRELFKNDDSKRYDRIIALTEVLSRFIFPLTSSLQSPSSPTPISCVTTIIDLENLSLRSLWSLRSHLQQSVSLNSAHAPETLSTIGIVNAPSWMPTLWSWIKTIMDEGTRNKIHILGKNPGEVLRGIIQKENLPSIYGGELEWKYEDEPSLDLEIKEALGVEEFPRGPLVFDGKLRLVGEGRGKEVLEEKEVKEEKEVQEIKEDQEK